MSAVKKTKWLFLMPKSIVFFKKIHNYVKSVSVGSYIKYNPVNMKWNVQWSEKDVLNCLAKHLH